MGDSGGAYPATTAKPTSPSALPVTAASMSRAQTPSQPSHAVVTRRGPIKKPWHQFGDPSSTLQNRLPL